MSKKEKNNKNVEQTSYSVSKMVWYNDKKGVDVVTREGKNPPSFNWCKRISETEYIDCETGEIKKYNKKKVKSPNVAFRSLRLGTRLLQSNIEGNEAERLIELCFAKKEKDSKKVVKKVNRFTIRLKNKIKQPVDIIKIWLYDARHQPRCHIWLKTKDNSKLEISQEMLEELWGAIGTVTQIEITKRNINKLRDYFLDKGKYKLGFYPMNLHIVTKSRGMKPLVIEKHIGKSELREKLKGYKPIYQNDIVQVVKTKNGAEIQSVIFETYIKSESADEELQEFIKEQEDMMTEMREHNARIEEMEKELEQERIDGMEEMIESLKKHNEE